MYSKLSDSKHEVGGLAGLRSQQFLQGLLIAEINAEHFACLLSSHELALHAQSVVCHLLPAVVVDLLLPDALLSEL